MTRLTFMVMFIDAHISCVCIMYNNKLYHTCQNAYLLFILWGAGNMYTGLDYLKVYLSG